MGKKIIIAASDSSGEDKKSADFVCTGKNDEKMINNAIELLVRGGTLQFLDGNYYIDDFDKEGNSAIYFGFNQGNARVINVMGDTENKSYNTRFGVTLHVTEAAFQKMKKDETYRVFYACSEKPEAEGDFFTYTKVNNVNFENFYLYLYDASRQIIGIDCENFGSTEISLVGIYTENYFKDRFLHQKPQTPVKNCIGINSMNESNDEMARIGFRWVNVGGLYTGFQLNGVDHLVMQCCSAARCCYGYVFTKTVNKTLTMINCCDEGNTHLPHFGGKGHITCIDFNIERFQADFIPDDMDGIEEPYATVDNPEDWHGFISYTLQGQAFRMTGFWRGQDGRNFITLDQNAPRSEWISQINKNL